MAVLSDSGAWLLTLNTSDLLGIQGHGEDNKIVVTQASGRISVYDIADQKLVKDWKVKGIHKLQSSAVYLTSSNQYAVAINEKTIKVWDKENLHVEEGKKITTKKAVHRLADVDDRCPMLVYSDGSCAWWNNPETLLVSSQLPSGSCPLWSHFTKVADVFVLVVIYMEKQKLVMCFHKFADDEDVSCSKHEEDTNDRKPLSFSIATTKTSVELFILWSDCSLTKRSYHLKQQLSSSQAVNLSMPLEICPSAAIVALDSTQVAIFGVERQKKVGVVVWNTRFGIIQSWQPLEASPSNHGQMYRLCGCLVGVGETGLHVLPFTYSPSSLKDTINKLSHDVQQKNAVDVLSTESAEILRSVILDLADANKTRTYKSFKERFGEFKKALSQKDLETSLWEQELTRLAHRCVAEKAFWPLTEISNLLETNVFQGRALGVLLPSFIQHKNMSLVQKCIHQMHIIPEHFLVQTLAFYLSVSDGDFPRPTSNGCLEQTDMEVDGDRKCPFGPSKALAVNGLIRLPCNDVFLLEALRDLDFQYVVDLMRYFCYLLQNSSEFLEESKDNEKPFLPIMLEWIGLLVDSHYAQMVLSSDIRDILLDLHQVVNSLTDFYQELAPLDGILLELKKGSMRRPKQNVGSYCIETLHVR